MRHLIRRRARFSPEGVFLISALVAILVMALSLGVQ